ITYLREIPPAPPVRSPQIEECTMSLVHRLALAGLCFAWLAPVSPAQTGKKEEKLPDKVSYYKDVRPIFMIHCQGCHQPAKAQGGYVMSSHADLFKKGDHEEFGIVAGQPDKSMIVKQILPEGGKPPAMPRGKEPLSDREVNLIKLWIAQGATNDTPASVRTIKADMDNP